MICPNCHRLQQTGAIECTACGVIFSKFRARPGRVKPLRLDLPKHGPWMLATGVVLGVALVWTWFNPGLGLRPSPALTPGGEPVPPRAHPEETPEQALTRRLRTVDSDSVEALQLSLAPIRLKEGQLGVDQVRVVAVLSTADTSVSATGRLDYTWVLDGERPRTSHTNVQALSFRRGRLEDIGKDVVYKELLRIDTPRERYAGKTLQVSVRFQDRRAAEASLVLEP